MTALDTETPEAPETPLTAEEWRELCGYLEQEPFVPITEAQAFVRTDGLQG